MALSGLRENSRTRLFTALLATAVVAGAGWGWARGHADASAQRDERVAYRLAFHSAELRDTEPLLSRRLAHAAFEIHPDAATRARLIDRLIFSHDLSGLAGEVALSSDGRTALIDDGSTTEVWDLTNLLDPESRRDIDPRAVLKGDPDWRGEIALSADGLTAITSDERKKVAIVWDLGDGTEPVRLATLPGDDDGEEHTSAVDSVASSADGRRVLLSHSDGDLFVWDLTDRSRPARVSVTKAHDTVISDIGLSADGRVAVTAADDGTVRTWDLADPAKPVKSADLLYVTESTADVAMSADGRTVLVATPIGLDTWRLDDRSPPKRIAQVAPPPALFEEIMQLNTVAALSLTADGTTALIAGSTPTGFLWDLSDPSAPVHLAQVKAEDSEIRSTAISGDGGVALTSGSEGVTLWDLRELDEIVADPGDVACDHNPGADIRKADWARFMGDTDWSDYGPTDRDFLPLCFLRP